jgi:hypothetical protein
MKGFGSRFHSSMNSSIAAIRSGTLEKLPRRTALPVSSANQRSTMFDQLEPEQRDLEARMVFQPAFYLAGLMSAVVVHHHVQFQLRTVLGIDLTQETQEFLAPVAWKAAAADCSSAIGHIVVSPRATAPALDRQSRLRTIQGLNLALFINAQHYRILGRVQVHPHHIQELRHEMRVSRELEGLLAVRL